MKKKYLPLLALCFSFLQINAQLEITLEPMADSYNFGHPVDIAHAEDGRLFIVARDGYIQILQEDNTVPTVPFLDIDDRVESFGGQGEIGLLGMTFHPDYVNNGFFYVHYTNNNFNSNISRFSVSADNPNLADANSELILMILEQPYLNHNGGCLKFGPDGYLYIGMGDGGSADDPGGLAQNLGEFMGKMLRIDVDGGEPYAIPTNNPFVDNENALDEIWSYGWRNPWRFSFDRETGDMWAGDVGQGAWEEIDFEAAGDPGGRNYGWRCYEGSEQHIGTCNDVGELTFPIYEYNHEGFTHCSVTGGYVYRGSEYPEATGTYLFGDICSGKIWGYKDDEVTELLTNAGDVLTSFGEDHLGEHYCCYLFDGIVYKIVFNDACGDVAPVDLELTLDNNILQAPEGYTQYDWFVGGVLVQSGFNNFFGVSGEEVYELNAYDGDCLAGTGVFLLSKVTQSTFVLQFDVWPNPTSDFVNIELELAQLNDAEITIQNTSGNIVFTEKVYHQKHQQQLDVRHFPKGLYVLQLKTKAGVISKRMLFL